MLLHRCAASFVWFYRLRKTTFSMVNCTSMAMPMTMKGAMRRWMPRWMQAEKRTMWSRKLTAWLPEKPRKRRRVGEVRKVKTQVN